MTIMDAIHLLIIAGRTEGLSEKVRRLCDARLITVQERDAVYAIIDYQNTKL